MIDLMFTDEHLEKLEIKEDTVLILRTPFQSSAVDLINAMRTIKAIVLEKTGHEPGLLLVPRDTDISLMDIDSLTMLKHEVQASLDYIYSKSGADTAS